MLILLENDPYTRNNIDSPNRAPSLNNLKTFENAVSIPQECFEVLEPRLTNIAAPLPSWCLQTTKWIGKVHRCAESKWISIKHWVIIEWQGRHVIANITRSTCCSRWGCLHIHPTMTSRCRRKSEVGNETVGIHFFGVIIKHLGLCIVLLVCTNGMSLGRTKLPEREWKGEGEVDLPS